MIPPCLFLHTFDSNIVAAWRSAFIDVPDTLIVDGDILADPCDAVVSPANSFGVMDGGIDRVLSLSLTGWQHRRCAFRIGLPIRSTSPYHSGRLCLQSLSTTPIGRQQFTRYLNLP
jgi:hypothetical protein